MSQSIMTGAALTAETLAEFKTRLHHDCAGAGYADHCTTQPVFVVKKREYVYGIDLDYADKRAIYCHDEYYHSISEFMESSSESFKLAFDASAQKNHELNFADLDEDAQFAMLAMNDHIQVVGYTEKWDYLNVHFTQSAADEFIQRSAHNYPDGLKVCQESQQYCPEFNAIRNAILSGKLVFQE
jgi:hypothetical protein